MDRLIEATARPGLPHRRRILLGAGAVIAAALAILIGLWWSRDVEPTASAPASEEVASAPPADNNMAKPVADASPPVDETLARAFRAAFGAAGEATMTIKGSRVTFRPERLMQLGDRTVLISAGDNAADCHACAGALGIHYLRAVGSGFELIGSWPAAVEGWGYGAPPTQWTISERLTRHPAIFAEGHFMGQGEICHSATLTELRPEGPVQSELIWTGYSNEGRGDEVLAGGGRVEDLDGAIANIRRDRSFEVRFTGTDRFTERYVRRGNRFVAAAGSRLPCG